MSTPATTTEPPLERNREAGYVGLGAAEFVALAMHENTSSSALTLSMLDLGDDALEALLTPIGKLYGRSSLAARGLLDVDGESIEPAGIGRLVAHATANATSWITFALVDDEGASDSLLVIDAPSGALIVVRRALMTFQVAAADLSEGVVALVWEVLERHLAETEAGTVVVGAAFPDGSTSKLALLRLDPDRDDHFTVAITDDLDETPADAVVVLDEDELEVFLETLLRGPQATSDAAANGEAAAGDATSTHDGRGA